MILAKEMGLTKYLIQQAKSEDWDIVVAGQRVQVIKDTDKGGKGTLQFGTEVITAEDGSVAALLGASPGASVSVDVMLDVMDIRIRHEMYKNKIKIRNTKP